MKTAEELRKSCPIFAYVKWTPKAIERFLTEVQSDARKELEQERDTLLREKVELEAKVLRCGEALVTATKTSLELAASEAKLRAALRSARDHRTEMGSSYSQWFHEVQSICDEALSTPTSDALKPLVECLTKSKEALEEYGRLVANGDFYFNCKCHMAGPAITQARQLLSIYAKQP